MPDPDPDSAPNSSTLLTGTFKQVAELPFLPTGPTDTPPHQDPPSIYPPVLIWTNKYISQGNIWSQKYFSVSQVFELVPIISFLVFRRKSLRLTNAQSSRNASSSVLQPGRAQSVFLKKIPSNRTFFLYPRKVCRAFLMKRKISKYTNKKLLKIIFFLWDIIFYTTSWFCMWNWNPSFKMMILLVNYKTYWGS